MSKVLYLDDSYLKEFEAEVFSVKDEKYVVLDKTAFYPKGGGQPCDFGKIFRNNEEFNVVFVGKFDNIISHEVDKQGLKQGDKVRCVIDWSRRYKLMRMHTAAHLLAGFFGIESGALITGNQLDTEESRMDFSLEKFDKEKIEECVKKSNELIKQDLPIKISHLKKEEAMKDQTLFKLAAGFSQDVENVRIVEIEGFDKQADGGTHVKSLKEIGIIELTRTENKGKSNRRVYFKLV